MMAAHAQLEQLEIPIGRSKRVKCGEVYTLENIEDGRELYVIECFLCSEHPTCTLTEFEEHMEIWHNSWERDSETDGSQDNQHLFENPEAVQRNSLTEPFEQVLIASESDAELQVEEISTSEIPESKIVQETSFVGVTLEGATQPSWSVIENTQNSKLTSMHIEKLIDLYKEQPWLWNQSHVEFGNTQLNRQSWQSITQKWSEFCGKQFTITDVRIRMSTLCQRYLKERDRLEEQGELDDGSKFTHYQRLLFLDEQQTLKKRRLLLQKHNTKLLEIYKHFPILWHSSQKYVRCPNERENAYRSISTALKLCGIHLSSNLAQQRLMNLRKCYRIEKIRFLHCLVEQTPFTTEFQHWNDMKFLHKHIEPFVCSTCGKIFENLVRYREHLNNENHHPRTNDDDDGDYIQVYGNCHFNNERMTCFMDNDLESSRYQSFESVHAANDSTVPYAAPTRVEEPSVDLMESMKEQCIFLKTVPVSGDLDKGKELAKTFHQNVKWNGTNTDKVGQKSNGREKESLVAQVQCESFSFNLPLQADSSCPKSTDSEKETLTVTDGMNRLSVKQTRKLIKLYKSYPQLWDPNHLDFHSRKLRAIAWRALTARLNKCYGTNYTRETIHRKLTDFVKYYKRERQHKSADGTKWCFYEDFTFIDDVISVTNELQKALQIKENNYKIIEVYKQYPQLWDTKHPEYTKRERQRYVVSMCADLQERDILITPEKLKNRLVEFRCNYKNMKTQRIAAAKRNESFVSDYEFCGALEFLEQHLPPFLCSCNMSFNRYTDFVRHEKKEHQASASVVNSQDNSENVCHICGISFTLRCNLLIHLKRHLGQRTHSCSMCPKMFFNATSARVHERSHTKQYPCVCEECGKSYVNTSKLNQHLKRHRNQRDHACEHCDKRFFTAFAKNRHVRRHLNIRDKVCPICGKAFVIGSSYYAHMMLHSDTKRYTCGHCQQKFSQYSGLYKHRKTKHANLGE